MVDETGLDETGLDETGLDETRTRRNRCRRNRTTPIIQCFLEFLQLFHLRSIHAAGIKGAVD